MTDSTGLPTDLDLEGMRARHVPFTQPADLAAYYQREPYKRCGFCGQDWPCDAALLLQARESVGGITEDAIKPCGCVIDLTHGHCEPVGGERMVAAIGATLDRFSAAITNSSGQISWGVFGQELLAALGAESVPGEGE